MFYMANKKQSSERITDYREDFYGKHPQPEVSYRKGCTLFIGALAALVRDILLRIVLWKLMGRI